MSRQVLRWLALDTDTSMTAGAFGLDPLAHTEPDRGLTLAHKTGTDTGIRCDVGVIGGPARTLAYAVLAEFDDDDRDAVLGRMFAHGQAIRELPKADAEAGRGLIEVRRPARPPPAGQSLVGSISPSRHAGRTRRVAKN